MKSAAVVATAYLQLAGQILCTAAAERSAVVLLLITQAGLLGYSATRHGPTHLEPAFLAAGISHWHHGRFELYRVNPPLVRIVAALPVLAIGCETDWSRFYESPGSRAEFPIGDDFIKINGPDSIPLFFYARWACIPFNLIGAYFAYRWAKELYASSTAGFITLVLYVFEPNLLAHGELITPDGPCTAFGILAGYTFWRWLRQPTWLRTALAGSTLGLAELSKLTWLILFGLWPLLWVIWRWKQPSNLTSQSSRIESRNDGDALHSGSHDLTKNDIATPLSINSRPFNTLPSLAQLTTILVISIYVINLGYVFDGFGTALKDFQFVSTTLSGLEQPGVPENRFRNTWLGMLPIPLPKQYVLGFDSQKRDLEAFPQKSYLRGEWKDGGWWYYYIYGLLVKVPCGTWGLLLLAIYRILGRDRTGRLCDELIILAPAATIIAVVSSQTEFNVHLRYVFPSLGLMLVFIGQTGCYLVRRSTLAGIHTIALTGFSVVSALLVYPHHLAYFNDFVGGPMNGHKHLLGSSFDWGQELTEVISWVDANRISRVCYVPSVDQLSGVAAELSGGRLQAARLNHSGLVVRSFASLHDDSGSTITRGQRIGFVHFADPALESKADRFK